MKTITIMALVTMTFLSTAKANSNKLAFNSLKVDSNNYEAIVLSKKEKNEFREIEALEKTKTQTSFLKLERFDWINEK